MIEKCFFCYFTSCSFCTFISIFLSPAQTLTIFTLQEWKKKQKNKKERKKTEMRRCRQQLLSYFLLLLPTRKFFFYQKEKESYADIWTNISCYTSGIRGGKKESKHHQKSLRSIKIGRSRKSRKKTKASETKGQITGHRSEIEGC